MRRGGIYTGGLRPPSGDLPAGRGCARVEAVPPFKPGICFSLSFLKSHTVTPMLTKNTNQLREVVNQHIDADSVIQGTYWNRFTGKGCFIGCLAHDKDPSINESRYGIPMMVQRIAESIFEALPVNDAKAFFAAFPDAVACDGKDLSRVGWQFLASELRSLPQQSLEIQVAIDPVISGIDLLAAGQQWAASAANAASDVAWTVARGAAWGTAWAAASAVSHAASAASAASATSAASSAAAAASSASYVGSAASDDASSASYARGVAKLRQRDLLLRLIADTPINVDMPDGRA